MPSPSKRLSLIPPYLFAEIARVKREAIEKGADIIDLGIGDPDLPTPIEVRNALTKAVENPATHRYDETPLGWYTFLDAAGEFYHREFGVEIDSRKEIVQLIGSKEGLAHLAWAYCDPGDVVITPNPGYTVYKVNSLMAGGEVFEMPLKEENGFLPVIEDIPSDVAKRAKLFYVCYPNNPTGATASREFYEKAVRFCKEYDILLVNDMAYATVAYDGYKNPTVLQVEGAKETSIEFHSLSKMYNMTGWRLGFALGNAEAVATLAKMKSNIDSKAFPAIAEAGAWALKNLRNEDTIAMYQRRRDLLCDGLNEIGWKVNKPKATFYVWAKVPRPDMTSAEFAKEMLERAHIVMIPGNGYGSEGEGYVRMSLTLLGDKDGGRFREAVKRIAESGLIPQTAAI
ncbi:MAG TPA: LL-diaminopimelate aminotransferase [Fimbriimonadaceae bacterium]|nr:LL-diaminopimelate aminotransferase [Fimbriimonadaceae bacterium]